MADAQAVHVVLPKIWLILVDGVPNTAGTKLVANVSFHTKVEETLTPCFTTLTELSMSDFGKSTNLTGVHAVEDMPHVIFKKTSTVPLKFINGEETPSNSGAPTALVDVDHLNILFYTIFVYFFFTSESDDF